MVRVPSEALDRCVRPLKSTKSFLVHFREARCGEARAETQTASTVSCMCRHVSRSQTVVKVTYVRVLGRYRNVDEILTSKDSAQRARAETRDGPRAFSSGLPRRATCASTFLYRPPGSSFSPDHHASEELSFPSLLVAVHSSSSSSSPPSPSAASSASQALGFCAHASSPIQSLKTVCNSSS